MSESFLERYIEFLDVIIWPAVILFVVVTFRDRLTDLLGRIAKISYGDTGVEFFQREMASVKREALDVKVTREPQRRSVRAATTGAAPETGADAALEMESPDELYDVSPDAAVILAWRELEAAVISTVSRLGIPGGGTIPAVRAAGLLVRDGYANATFLNSIVRLHRLRNAVAHARQGTIPAASASDYVFACREMREHLATI